VPETVETTSTTATLMWDDPGGRVDNFLIALTPRESGQTVNIIVDGQITTFTLIDLVPATTYNVVIFTVNTQGVSIASPLHVFTTACELAKCSQMHAH